MRPLDWLALVIIAVVAWGLMVLISEFIIVDVPDWQDRKQAMTKIILTDEAWDAAREAKIKTRGNYRRADGQR